MSRSPSPPRALRTPLALALALASSLGAQQDAAPPAAPPTAPIGVRSRIDQLVLPGGRLEARPVDRDTPVMLRVVQVWPHGTGFRYDLEWVGLVAGPHDLARYLQYEDGVAEADRATLPRIPVVVTAMLPDAAVEPNDLAPQPPPQLGGYTNWLIAAASAWALGLLAILFVGRRRRAAVAVAAAPPRTLADRLRPLVEAAARGELSTARQAELERLLLAFWRERAGIAELKASAAIERLRAHPEAGPLLQQLGRWLHAPPGAGAAVDVTALLEPYRHVGASSVDAAPPAAEAAR